MRRAVLSFAAVLGLALPAAASASPSEPFGHPCTAQNGVRFCPTSFDDQRVPSFDGTPMDVDVTLPASGTAPYPTIIMLHGFPGTKASAEADSAEGKDAHTYHWNNTFYAQQGYAVINASSRGFGRSCGVADSRTSPACDMGWIHPVSDQRFELRDVQHLLGLLVDEGVTDPDRIGVTGTSGGGGATMQLAFLENRVRNTDGTLAPWRSPAGKGLSIAAAYPRWGYFDLIYALVPNGRALDFRSPLRPESVSPIGVPKNSVLNILAAGGAAGFIAPAGADPTADLTNWVALTNAGDPYGGEVRALARQLATYKSATGISQSTSTPLLVQVGWTDPVFSAIQAIRPYTRQRAAGELEVALQLGDVGHFTGGNGLGQYMRFNDEGAEFFGRWLKGEGGAVAPGGVTAFLQGCPKGSKGSGVIRAADYESLARGSFVLKRRSGTVRSTGGSDESAKVADPVQTSDRCTPAEPGSSAGTTVLTRESPGFTLLGLTTITGRVRADGDFGQLEAILWELRKDGTQRLVDFGVYRLTKDQSGTLAFQLQGNGYRFEKGSTVKLELRGRTPNLFFPSNATVATVLSDIRAELPTRERAGSRRGIQREPTRPVITR